MSIDQLKESYLDDRTGNILAPNRDNTQQQLETNKQDKLSVTSNGNGREPKVNKLKLSKSSSASKCDAASVGKSNPVLSRSEKSESALQKNKNDVNDNSTRKDPNVESQPLAEYIQQKTGKSLSLEVVKLPKERKEKVVHSQKPLVIDLTEDENIPAPVIKSTSQEKSFKNPIEATKETSDQAIKPNENVSESSKPIKSAMPLNNNANQPMKSFEALSKQAGQFETGSHQEKLGQGKQWTQARTQSTGPAQQAGFKPATSLMHQSLQADIQARNELAKKLEKQKALVATVKMSQLPDKGERLMSTVETMATTLADLDHKLKVKVAQLNSQNVASANSEGSVSSAPNPHQSSQTVPKQPQVIRVYPVGP
ncbi:uncharacterized protein LOC127857215 [Dreissena polymorpha]|uniref:uncharacterized protein LOC127857215 n=1 Tax=Dreissena polymorpha TaxID=45954 RepID=UPI0022644838|nr:uncharacterized protein LOC127857215 [Dreissena polymorpha]